MTIIPSHKYSVLGSKADDRTKTINDALVSKIHECQQKMKDLPLGKEYHEVRQQWLHLKDALITEEVI